MLKKYFAILSLILLSGCYRMPTEDDYCVIPTTNHPDIVHDQNTSVAPNFKY